MLSQALAFATWATEGQKREVRSLFCGLVPPWAASILAHVAQERRVKVTLEQGAFAATFPLALEEGWPLLGTPTRVSLLRPRGIPSDPGELVERAVLAVEAELRAEVGEVLRTLIGAGCRRLRRRWRAGTRR